MDISSIPFALPLAVCLLCALVLRPSPARAETGPAQPSGAGEHAAILALPFPVIIVEARSLRLHTANAACIRDSCLNLAPDAYFPDFFADADKVEDFLRSLKDDRAVGPRSGAAAGSSLGEELACLLKNPAGGETALILSLFFIEQRPGLPALLFLTVDFGSTLASAGLRRCFDAFPDMLFFRDLEGRFLLCNRAFSRFCGKNLDEILGRTVRQLELSPYYEELFCAHDQDVLAFGMNFTSEMSGLDRGKLVCLENHSHPDVAPDGSVRGIFSVCRDISEARATSEALHRQSALLQAGNDAALMLFSDDEDLETLASRALGGIGAAIGVDQVDVWRNHGSSEEGLLCTQVYCWNKTHVSAHFSPHANTAAYNAHLPGWEELLSSGKCVDTPARALSPQEREHLDLQGLRDVLAVPIIFRSSFWGFIRLGVRSADHNWGKG